MHWVILCVDACPTSLVIHVAIAITIIVWAPCMYLRVVVSHQAFLRWMGYFDDDDDDEQQQQQIFRYLFYYIHFPYFLSFPLNIEVLNVLTVSG